MMTTNLDAGMRALADGEIDQVDGGIIPLIAPGIALGLLYCYLTGDFDIQRTFGDYEARPKNTA